MGTEAQTPATNVAESAGLSAEGQAQSLLDQISEAALKETGGDVWRSGQPLATPNHPPVEKKEADAKPAEGEGSTPPPSKEAPSWDPGVDYLKKYKSPEEAAKGIDNLLQKVQEQERELAQLKAPPKQETPPADPADELVNYGLPKEPIKALMEQAFLSMLEKQSKPVMERLKADQEIISRYPDYKEKFSDLSQWLETKPDLKNQVVEAENAGHYLLAREYAWLHYTRNGASQAETQMKERAKAETQENKKAKMDARTMANGQTTEPRPNPAQEAEERKIIKADEFERLVALAKDGYEAPLWRRAIGETLSKDVFPDA